MEVVMENSELKAIYDGLFEFESKKKKAPYAIHKGLQIDGKNLIDWIAGKILLDGRSRVLDAGCGTGNTLFQFHKQFGMAGVGLSISSKEIEFASNYAQKSGLENYLFFECRDFSKSMDDLGAFDYVFAIESLKHTNNPYAVIRRLLDQLKPGGKLLIADDFLLGEEQTQDLEKHKEYWAVPGFATIQQLKEMLSELELHYELTELSQYVPTKHEWQQKIILSALKGMKKLFKTSNPILRNLKTYEGAILLEMLYLRKMTGYFLIEIHI